jgi:hypothetical protein
MSFPVSIVYLVRPKGLKTMNEHTVVLNEIHQRDQ